MAAPTTPEPTRNPEPVPPSHLLVEDSNGSPTRAFSSVIRTRRWSRRATVLGVSVVVVLLAGGAGCLVLAGMKPAYPDLRTHTVHYDTLPVQINERGRVESAHNNDLICRIKARTADSPIATSILWVIDEGSHVEKGQKLMELDASALEEQRKGRLIEVDEARSALVRAQGNYDSALIGRRTSIACARRAVELARIELKRYSEGEYRQKVKEFEARLQETRNIVEMWEDRTNWSERVAQRGYITPSQAHSDDMHHRSAREALARQTEQRRFLDLEKEHTEMAKNGLIDEAKDKLERAITDADADVESKKLTLDAAQKRYDLARSRLADVEGQIDSCTITAPQSGMVIYYRDEEADRPNRIRQGERVSEGQKLLRIPDMKNMQIATLIPESAVAKLHGDGQPVLVRVDAFPDRELRGHVARVSPVPSPQDFLPADIKLYPVTIALDEPLDDLRLGMSARVSIDTDQRAEHVLTVPLQAVVGPVRAGSVRQCYVVTPNGSEQRDIVVGLGTGETVEIRSGLQEGDVIILNPLPSLGYRERAEHGGGQHP